MTDSNDNGVTELTAVPEPVEAPQASIHLDMTVAEADALHGWLLKSTSEGVAALEDPLVSASLKQLSHQLDYIHTVATVRDELESAGFDTQSIPDDQVAELARRIREAKHSR